MFRRDLDAAGIAYAVEGPDGPEYADFHSLRHTYLTMLGRHGVDLRTAQELAGHSTPLLTARYSHRRLYDLQGAADRLPNLTGPSTTAPEKSVAELRRTGTDAAPAAVLSLCPAAPKAAPMPRPDAVPDAVTCCIRGHQSASLHEQGSALSKSQENGDRLKKSNPALFCTGLRRLASSYPAWIRTRTKRTKISCATVTLPGSPNFSGWLGCGTPVSAT